MPPETLTAQVPPVRSRNRADIPDRFKWDVGDIFPNWEGWDAAYRELEAGINRYAELKGTLSKGPASLLEAFRQSEALGQLAYRVWYYPSLQ
jgi:oligoendopeptidase F